jgi:acyl-CoA thioester hydrolase
MKENILKVIYHPEDSSMNDIIKEKYFAPDCPHKIFVSHFTIYENDLDILGHMNNANYMRYFEKARWDFIEEGGYGVAKIKALQKGPVLLDAKITFRKELSGRDKISIYSQMQSIQGKFFTLKQLMIKDQNILASEATFMIGFFDLSARKLIIPTHEWLEAIGFHA